MAYVAFTKVAYKNTPIPLSLNLKKGVEKGTDMPFEMLSFEGRDAISAVEGLYETYFKKLLETGRKFIFEESNKAEGIEGYILVVNKDNPENDKRKIPVFSGVEKTEEIETENRTGSALLEELFFASSK